MPVGRFQLLLDTCFLNYCEHHTLSNSGHGRFADTLPRLKMYKLEFRDLPNSDCHGKNIKACVLFVSTCGQSVHLPTSYALSHRTIIFFRSHITWDESWPVLPCCSTFYCSLSFFPVTTDIVFLICQLNFGPSSCRRSSSKILTWPNEAITGGF